VIDSFRNIFAIPDLRKRLLFTFALLAVYRVGAFIPIPGVDPMALAEFAEAAKGTVLGMLNLFSGGALGRMTVFALGIMPYISASIILQLLTVVWPYLEKLSKEGELGRRKITQYGYLLFPGENPGPRGSASGSPGTSGLGFPVLDSLDLDDWNSLCHVAR